MKSQLYIPQTLETNFSAYIEFTEPDNFETSVLTFVGETGKFAGSEIIVKITELITEENTLIASDGSIYFVDGVQVEPSAEVLQEMVETDLIHIIKFLLELGEEFSHTIKPQEKVVETLSQQEIQILRAEVRQILSLAYDDIRLMKTIKGDLWELCDKATPETSETYRDYLNIASHLDRLNERVKKFAKISAKLKKMERS